MTRRLHDITDDLLRLEEHLLETGGEWTPEIEAIAKSLELDLEAKVDGYAALISEWEADALKWKAEEERVAGHRRARENAAKRLKARLCEELERVGRSKVETPRFAVSVQSSAPAVTVTCDPSELPVHLVRRIPTRIEPDKAAIAAALKALPEHKLVSEKGGFPLVLAEFAPASKYVRIR